MQQLQNAIAWKTWLVGNQEELSDLEPDEEANPEAMDFYGGAAPSTPQKPRAEEGGEGDGQ